MNLIKIMFTDVVNGLRKNWFVLLTIFIITFMQCQTLIYGMVEYLPDNGSLHISFIDCLISIFKGIEEFNPNEPENFRLPIYYMVINLLLAFLIGDYPTKDLSGFGKQIIIKCGRIKSWYTGKIAFCLLSVVEMFFSVFASIAVCLLINSRISGFNICFLPESEEVFNYINPFFDLNYFYAHCAELLITFFLLPFISCFALCSFQMMLSFVVSPVVSYISVIIIHIFSLFYMSPLLPGNYQMFRRNVLYEQCGVTNIFGIVYCTAIIIITLLSGYIIIKRRDII